MNALKVIENEFANIGYVAEAIIRDYTFADVLTPIGLQRSVAIAAFTQTPASYRTAAFGVIDQDKVLDISEYLMGCRSLGAPVMLSISGDRVTVWQVRASEKPRCIGEYTVDQIPSIFKKHSKEWAPDSIHRAKSLGAFDLSYQLDFVDIGLLPVLEGEIHVKLDRLLQEVILKLKSTLKATNRPEIDYRTLFQGTFRLLAAKILLDRKHEQAAQWESSDITTIFKEIASYYRLGTIDIDNDTHATKAFDSAWAQLLVAISFRNISADDLAFIYENTLVTPETRKIFGTHSTPRQVAEYVVGNLGLSRLNLDSLRVYEPFSGAGIFLVSAIRHMRDLLPGDWNESRRHTYLVERIGGSEIDPFACEVATLSLILADYPNANGWHINDEDLFTGSAFLENLQKCNVVVCNPPFEDFTFEERAAYSSFASRSIHKPIAVLDFVLDHHPEAIGFVLPRGFILDQQYASARKKVEERYTTIELVSLPDRIFNASVTESCLLIAREKRVDDIASVTNLISTTVNDIDRTGFLSIGKISSQRQREIMLPRQRTGQLWLPELEEIWSYLESYPKLGTIAEIHRGLEWNYPQTNASSDQEKPGFKRGLLTVDRSMLQFQVANLSYIDCNRESLRGNAIEHPWNAPKVIANAARLSRGHWRFAASPDRSGLICSQQFFGIWPRNCSINIDVLAALLNNPIANSYLTIFSPAKGLRISKLKNLPVPTGFDSEHISKLVKEYQRTATKLPLEDSHRELKLNSLLVEIDAFILRAYDLPPRLERKLLEFFRHYKRPTASSFEEWFPANFSPFIPLHEYITSDYSQITGKWIKDVFKPLTQSEAKILQDYLD